MAGKFSKIDAPVTSIHSNLDQSVIQITEDRLRLCLIEHLGKIEDRKAWVAPASLLAAILTTFATTDFKDFAWLKAATWEAVFLVIGLITAGWLFVCLRKMGRAPTVSNIVESIKLGVH